jgi:hypothetical protein
MRSLLFVFLLVFTATASAAEDKFGVEQLRLLKHQTGPRIGVTHISGDISKYYEEMYQVHTSNMTQLGWQFEFETNTLKNGTRTVTQITPLLTGFESHVALPSISATYNLRPSLADFGAGVFFGSHGSGLALTVGKIMRYNKGLFPAQLRFIQSQRGTEFSILFSILSL